MTQNLLCFIYYVWQGAISRTVDSQNLGYLKTRVSEVHLDSWMEKFSAGI